MGLRPPQIHVVSYLPLLCPCSECTLSRCGLSDVCCDFPQRDFLRLPAQAPGSHTLGSYAAGPCTPGPHDVSAIQRTLSHPGLKTVLQLQCTGEPSCCRCLGCTGNCMPEGSGTSQEVTQQRNCESASTDPKHLQQTSEGPDYEVREYNSEHRQ